MGYEVTKATVVACPTVVVKAITTWPEFRSTWKDMLDKVWACLHDNGITHGCPNVMLYLNDQPSVEIGVKLSEKCELSDPVVVSELPAGLTASTIHRGQYGDLDQAHKAIIEWCDKQSLTLAGPRWEIYGPNASVPEVEVFYLLHNIQT
jgi:effector-binding domain-containing protein